MEITLGYIKINIFSFWIKSFLSRACPLPFVSNNIAFRVYCDSTFTDILVKAIFPRLNLSSYRMQRGYVIKRWHCFPLTSHQIRVLFFDHREKYWLRTPTAQGFTVTGHAARVHVNMFLKTVLRRVHREHRLVSGIAAETRIINIVNLRFERV